MLTVELMDAVSCQRTADVPGRQTITAPKGMYTAGILEREYILRPITESNAVGARYLLTIAEFDKLRADGKIVERNK